MSFVLLQCAWLISYSVATCGSARHWQRPTCVTLKSYSEGHIGQAKNVTNG